MLQNHRSSLECVLAAALAVVLVGCSKPSEPEPPPAPTLKSAPAEQPAATDWPEPPAAPAEPAAPAPRPAPAQTPDDVSVPARPTNSLAEQAVALEQRYLGNPELGRRLDVIFKLTELDGHYSVPSLAKLFQAETDVDLKIEILDALADIRGGADAKLTLLTAAIHPQQHQEVRQAALEALADLGDPRALPMVQQLLSDPDVSIRQHALTVAEQLRKQSAK